MPVLRSIDTRLCANRQWQRVARISLPRLPLACLSSVTVTAEAASASQSSAGEDSDFIDFQHARDSVFPIYLASLRAEVVVLDAGVDQLVSPGPSSISRLRLLAGSVSGHRWIDETTEYPESLCPMSALPPLERRRSPLRRALPHLPNRWAPTKKFNCTARILANVRQSRFFRLSPKHQHAKHKGLPYR